MTRFRLLGLALSLLVVAPLSAQSADGEQQAVLGVMKQLFDGMRAGDSAMVAATFHPRIQMSTALDRQGTATLEMGEAAGFLKAVGTPHAEMYDERVYNPIVHIDGPLATIWVEYSFFVGPKFSHCGVDAFLMAKEGSAWKIIAISDTRRRTGCRES